MDLKKAEQLLALAVDESTTIDEQRAAAWALSRMIKEDDFLATIRSLVEQVRTLMGVFAANRQLLARAGVRVPSDW